MHDIFQRLFGTRVCNRGEANKESRCLQFWCPPSGDSQWKMQHEHAITIRRTISSREGMHVSFFQLMSHRHWHFVA